jgi:hypothetical protein
MKTFLVFFFFAVLLVDCSNFSDNLNKNSSDSLTVIIKSHPYQYFIASKYDIEFVIPNVNTNNMTDIKLETDTAFKGTLTEKNGIFRWTYNKYLYKIGKNYFKGNLKFVLQDKKYDLPIIDSFEVTQPDGAISLENGQNNLFLIKNKDNYFRVYAPGYVSSDLIVTAKNATLTKADNFGASTSRYKVIPENDSDVIITINALGQNTFPNLFSSKYKVVNIKQVQTK